MEFQNNPVSSSTMVLAIAAFTVLLIIFIVIYSAIRNRKLLKSVTTRKRGTPSERDLIMRLLKKGIPAVTLFHDLCIEKRNGKFAQIDVVMVTTEGIIVFEVKDYKGWIYGSGYNTTWTKVLNYGKLKFPFYNPIKQNLGHIKAIKSLHSQLKDVPFYSVVIFYGECELKEINYVPAGTYIVKKKRLYEVLRKIKKENQPAAYRDKRAVVNVLQKAVDAGANSSNQLRHIANIKDTVGKHRIFR